MANKKVERMKKAQAAMEYLITYGWAVLIMLVVVGALFYLGVFTQNPIATCTFQNAGFTCYSSKLTSNTGGSGGLIIDLAQGTGHDIKIVGFNCTTNNAFTVIDFDAATNNVTIPTGSHSMLNGSVTNQIPFACYKPDGTKLGVADAGSVYRGKLYIHYWDLETNMDHKVTGDISGKVE
jgi:hypothetical protein